MKKRLLLITITLSISNLAAICSWNSLTVFPIGMSIKQNTIFVLDGYAASQIIIKGLNDKFPIYLLGKNHKVKLNIKETLVGQFELTQALLVPETDLIVGMEYTLIIDNLPENELLVRWNSELNKSGPIVYKVTEGKDSIKPIFKTIPKEIKKTYHNDGCGPTILVTFDCNVIDSSEYLIKTTVKCIETRKKTTYYIASNKGEMEIGHGMCYGPFHFEDGDNYEVKFSLMDASGNLTIWSGYSIEFTKPIDKNAKEEEKGEEY